MTDDMQRNVLRYIFLSLFVVCLASCKKDIGLTDEIVGTGESLVECAITFRPMTPALNGKTRAAGDAIKGINSLCVLLYDGAGNLVENYPIIGYKESQTPTSRATFSLKVPYGRYYVYAVANMGDLAVYAEAIKTVDGLKKISFDWNSDDIAANSQMFGYFNLKGSGSGGMGSAPLLTINKKNMALEAGIRRAASKVTLAYDGSQLAEGVFVYIESVQIKDIPSSCLLGDSNIVKSKAGLIDGAKIAYVAPGTPINDNWPALIAKGRPYFPYDAAPEKLSTEAHSESAEALFFYENMQGQGKDKAQDRENMGDKSKPKDDKPYGTYIEVTGYYRSINPDKVGNGPIKYRFMLGKDIKTDYNAERNYHYKLTLCFNKFANDADWHIDYEIIPPSLAVPDEYYISYLYNRTMNLPITIHTGGGKLKSLSARILTNNWAPYNSDLNYASQYDYEAYPDRIDLNKPWNGFLSLRKTKYKILDNAKEDNPEGGIHKISDNKSYYEDPSRPLGEREYKVKAGTNIDAEDGDYSLIYNDSDQTVDIQIPFYTREKQLIINTGYTGNNPYVAYRRHATVEITAEVESPTGDGSTELLKDTCNIFQGRRIVNPKGIYRSHDKTTPFHVNLKVLPKEDATSFMPLTSYGPWRATVVSEDGDFVTLDGGKEVSGTSGSQIDFTVGFSSTCRANESRCAVIRVEYNYYSCHHLIFVRQGHAPIRMISNGVKWHTFNLLTKDNEVASPCDEGSLFRYGNLEQPIAASNQKNKRSPWIHVEPTDFSSDINMDFELAGGGTSKWDSIKYDSYDAAQPHWMETLDLSGARIARYEDYHLMFNDSAIEFNYGVLYGDEATETATLMEDVYGYRSGDSITTAGRGMRGCFVYNSETGKNLFFPIGASGYGRRRGVDGDWSGSFTKNAKCVHRYASRTTFYPEPGLGDRPLFYDLFMRPGALYWLERKNNGQTNLDINYFTFDFNVMDLSGSGDSDACFIRCVEDN